MKCWTTVSALAKSQPIVVVSLSVHNGKGWHKIEIFGEGMPSPNISIL